MHIANLVLALNTCDCAHLRDTQHERYTVHLVADSCGHVCETMPELTRNVVTQQPKPPVALAKPSADAQAEQLRQPTRMLVLRVSVIYRQLQ